MQRGIATFTLDSGNNRIQIFQLNNFGWFSSNEMTFVDQIQEVSGLASPGLSGPMAVVCAPGQAGQVIYVADTGNGRVVKIEVQQDEPASTPLHVWESMKAALWVYDTDRALTFFADKERYAAIFQLLDPYLQDYVTGMGAMTLASRESGKVKYEMLHNSSGYSFPVFFVKDEDGNWRIFNF